MKIRQGIGVSHGYATGPALVLDREEYRVERRFIPSEEIGKETSRLDLAFEAAVREISDQLKRHAKKLGPVAEILKAHVTLLQDAPMREEILKAIRTKQFMAE